MTDFLARLRRLIAGDRFKADGWFEIEHVRDGRVIERRTVKNLVTSAGKAALAGLLNGVVTDFFEYLAIGTGTTAAAAGDTALQTEITTNGGARAAATCTRVTTTVTNDTAQLEYTWTFSGSFAVTELGILSANSGGTLLARSVFAAINVLSGDGLNLKYKIAVS